MLLKVTQWQNAFLVENVGAHDGVGGVAGRGNPPKSAKGVGPAPMEPGLGAAFADNPNKPHVRLFGLGSKNDHRYVNFLKNY